jgi:hypothetical protein
MIPLKRIPLLLALFLSVTATGYAQKFCTVAPPSPFKHNALIVTSYDQRARRMKTTLEHPNALGNGLRLYASFYYQDSRLRSTPMIDIFFIAASKKPLYRDSHELKFTADGNLWPLSMRAQYYTEDGPKGTTLEKTRITLAYPELMTLLKSRRVRASLGASEFELSFNHLESLRELAMLMAPRAPAGVAKR